MSIGLILATFRQISNQSSDVVLQSSSISMLHWTKKIMNERLTLILDHLVKMKTLFRMTIINTALSSVIRFATMSRGFISLKS
jgi:hypothetical protein